MSYQVIARKWRPQAFEEVTGQEHVTRTLRNAIEYGRLHHAYLFSGARGVGKTTTARLLAKALNCHKTPGPNVHPCRVGDPDACASCVEISESRSIDVIEFDAASNTQVEKIRDIVLENIQVAPARDRFKVFIIDEVHQLSNHSFNALLKTLEEPPGNVMFIMATTELHKVPDTILSRCQQFEFRTIAVQKILERLKLIAEAENIEVSEEALREIARSGEGSMRDAQSNFDQVISFSGESIEVSDVTSALGLAGSEMLIRATKAIEKKDAKAILGVVDELIAGGHDLRNFSRDLLGVFRDLLVFKVSGGEADLLEGSAVPAEDLDTFAAAFSEADLLRFFNSLGETESKLKEATQSRYVLEMGLVRLIEMRRVAPVEKILERLAALETGFRNIDDPPSKMSKAAASPPNAEKKTLRSPEVGAEPDFGPYISSEEPPFHVSELTREAPEPSSGIPGTFIDLADVDSLPIKLPPIASEELEHIEDNWLDNAYEEKLLRSGDNLLPFAASAALAHSLIGTANGNGRTAAASDGNGGRSLDLERPVFMPPDFGKESTDTSLPSLPENPTEEQLLAYANAHPRVKKVLRVFRAKIVEIRKG